MSKRSRSEINKNKYDGNLPEVVEKSKFIEDYRVLCGELIDLLSGDTKYAIEFKPTLSQIALDGTTLKMIVSFTYPSNTPIRLLALSDLITSVDDQYTPFLSFDGHDDKKSLLIVECHRPHE